MGIIDRLWCWRHGVCTKHLIYMNYMQGYSWCNKCDKERILKGKLKERRSVRKLAFLRRKYNIV